MPTPQYTALATTTIASAVQYVRFTSINQTYRDLLVVVNGQLVTSGSLILQFNLDTATNYSTVDMYGTGSGTGSGASSYSGAALFGRSFSITSGNQFIATSNILDYAATDKHKTVLNRGNSANQLVEANAARWASTAAITTVEVQNIAGNFSIGTTFSLYGVK